MQNNPGKNTFFVGFTLLELLIAVAVVGVLSGLFVITFPASQQRARDSQRINDLKQYQSALEIFAFKNSGSYPIYDGAAYNICDDLGLGTTCTKDPKETSSICSGNVCEYKYVSSTGGKYVLYSAKEKPSETGGYYALCSNGLSGEVDSSPTGDICPVSTCALGTTFCGSSCVDLDTDNNNCGTCGVACSVGNYCSLGVCQAIVCSPPTTLCLSSCVNTAIDNNNCGGCGNVCSAGTYCSSGMCCNTGLTSCSGICRNLSTDTNNCGSCGYVCTPGFNCVSGSCTLPSCPVGQTLCSGVCRNLNTDSSNCGSCGIVCSGGKICVSGSCTCPSGQSDCSGTCKNLQTDNANCGTCGNICSAGYTCNLGVCTSVACLPLSQVCTIPSQCCSNNCEFMPGPNQNRCCSVLGGPCTSGSQCCPSVGPTKNCYLGSCVTCMVVNNSCSGNPCCPGLICDAITKKCRL